MVWMKVYESFGVMDTLIAFLPKIEQISLQAVHRYFYETVLYRTGSQIRLSLFQPLFFPGIPSIEKRYDRFVVNKKWTECDNWYSI